MRSFSPNRTAKAMATLAAIFAAALLTKGGPLGAEEPAAPRTSSFAPAKELQGQIDYFLDRLDTALDQQKNYNEADQARVQKDANLMILLFMAMALHDENPPLQGSAADLVPLAEKLTRSFNDTKAARASYADLLKRLKDPTPAREPIRWEKRAHLGLLMKHVALINNRLRRSMRKSRFERDAEKTSGYATLLALIAQATYLDTHDVKDPKDVPRWLALSVQWRDSAAALGEGARQQDFQAATHAMIRMTKNCDDCHAQFRKEPLSVKKTRSVK